MPRQFSAEHRRKISEAAKKRFSVMTADARREAMRPAFEKSQKDPSAIRRANESRAIIYAEFGGPNKGRTASAETRAKMSASQRRRLASTTAAERSKLYGHGKSSVSTKPDNGRRRPKSAEHRAKIALGVASYRKDSEYSFVFKPSSLEVKVRSLLDAVGVEYEAPKQIGRYVVDLYIPSCRLVIECDGAYWHSLPGALEKDRRRDETLLSSGYRVLRLPEATINKGDPVSLVKEAMCS